MGTRMVEIAHIEIGSLRSGSIGSEDQMVTYDPVAAARAAAEAAAAARAAAEAAAAAQAEAEASRPTTTPRQSTTEVGLAADSTRQILEDTEALGAGDVQMDGSAASSMLDRDAAALFSGESRDSLLAMPALSSALDLHGEIAGPSLDTDQPDRPAFDSSLVSSGIVMEGRASSSSTGPANFYDASGRVVGTLSTSSYYAPTWDPNTGTYGQTERFVQDYTDKRTGNRTVTDTRDGVTTVRHYNAQGEPISDEDWNRPESHSDDNEPLVTTGATANDVTVWWDELTGTNSSGATGGGGTDGGGVAYVPPDDDPMGQGNGTLGGGSLVGGGLTGNDVLAGVTGAQPIGRDLLGPQGGGTTVNPDPNSDSSDAGGRRTSLDGATAYDWVGQPETSDPDLKPAGELQALAPGVDMDTTNPSGGEGTTASTGSAKASTASSSMAFAPASGGGATEDGLLDGLEDAMPADDLGGLPMADAGLPLEDAENSAMDAGRGHGHGRGAGRDHGHAHGDGDEALEAEDS